MTPATLTLTLSGNQPGADPLSRHDDDAVTEEPAGWFSGATVNIIGIFTDAAGIAYTRTDWALVTLKILDTDLETVLQLYTMLPSAISNTTNKGTFVVTSEQGALVTADFRKKRDVFLSFYATDDDGLILPLLLTKCTIYDAGIGAVLSDPIDGAAAISAAEAAALIGAAGSLTTYAGSDGATYLKATVSSIVYYIPIYTTAP